MCAGMVFYHMTVVLLEVGYFYVQHSTVISLPMFLRFYDREYTVIFSRNELDGFIVADMEGRGNNVTTSLLTGLLEKGLMRNIRCVIKVTKYRSYGFTHTHQKEGTTISVLVENMLIISTLCNSRSRSPTPI